MKGFLLVPLVACVLVTHVLAQDYGQQRIELSDWEHWDLDQSVCDSLATDELLILVLENPRIRQWLIAPDFYSWLEYIASRNAPLRTFIDRSDAAESIVRYLAGFDVQWLRIHHQEILEMSGEVRGFTNKEAYAFAMSHVFLETVLFYEPIRTGLSQADAKKALSRLVEVFPDRRAVMPGSAHVAVIKFIEVLSPEAIHQLGFSDSFGWHPCHIIETNDYEELGLLELAQEVLGK